MSKPTVLRFRVVTVLGFLATSLLVVFQNCGAPFQVANDLNSDESTSLPSVVNDSQPRVGTSVPPVTAPTPGATPNPGVTPSPTPSPTPLPAISNLGGFLTPQAVNVFVNDPVTDAKDLTLSPSADFSKFASEKTLKNVLASQKFLANGAVFVTADDEFPSDIANPQGSLRVPFRDAKFNQINSYYHIERLTASLGEGNRYPANNTGIVVNAHCKTGASAEKNAYFDIAQRKLCLGWGKVGATTVWASEDADVVVHEFGHSINHTRSSTAILTSTIDLEALDEGFADLWAFSQNRQVALGKWFGNAMDGRGYVGIRKLGATPEYPKDANGNRHADSVFFSSAVAEYLANDPTFPVDKVHDLITRLLSGLQIGNGLAETLLDLQTEGAVVGMKADMLKTALQKRGLYRKDDLAPLQLNSTKPLFVVDGKETSSFMKNGNCNGALDQGETVFLLPNLVNTATKDMGSIRWTLTSKDTTGKVKVLPGGDVGSLVKIMGQSTYANFLQSLSRGSKPYNKALGYASFAISADAAAPAGKYDFTLTVAGFNSIDEQSVTRSFPLSLDLGTATGECADEESVLP